MVISCASGAHVLKYAPLRFSKIAILGAAWPEPQHTLSRPVAAWDSILFNGEPFSSQRDGPEPHDRL